MNDKPFQDPFVEHPGDSPQLRTERAIRRQRWSDFQKRAAGRLPTWDDVHDTYIFRPLGQGIWLDNTRTRAANLSPDHAFSVLLTENYNEGVIDGNEFLYAYPRQTAKASDVAISGMKASLRNNVPIFFIDGLWQKYSVRIAWVLDFNDDARLFLLGFTPPSGASRPGDIDDTTPYPLSSPQRQRISSGRMARTGQARFAFDTLLRYGTRCAFCDIDAPQVLTAAHIRPVAKRGPDDARNGLVLCASHHMAFDKGLIRIDPDTLAVRVALEVGVHRLSVTRQDLNHLQRQPTTIELRWRAEYYKPYAAWTW